MLKPILSAAFAIGLALSAHDAAAATITVLNPSFEQPALPGPGISNGPVGGITNWTTTSTGVSASAGVWYLPQAPYFTIGAPVGNQVAFVYSGTGATGSGLISQTTSSPFQTGTTYSLSFYVGELVPANGFSYPTTVQALLYEGNPLNVLATFPVNAPLSGPGTFQLDTFSYLAASNPFPAGNIGVEFFIAGGPNSMATFDNVSLSATTAPVPEPTSLLLLAMGLIGFALHRRRAAISTPAAL